MLIAHATTLVLIIMEESARCLGGREGELLLQETRVWFPSTQVRITDACN